MPCLPLSEIMCSFKPILKHLQQWLRERVFESACLMVEHVTHSALQQRSNVHLLRRRVSTPAMQQSCRSWGIIWHRDWNSRSESSTCKDTRFPPLVQVENILEYHWTLTPYIRSEITLGLHRNYSCQFSSSSFSTVSFFHTWSNHLESFCLSLLASVSGRSRYSFKAI